MKARVITNRKHFFTINIVAVIFFCCLLFLSIPRNGIYHHVDMNIINYGSLILVACLLTSFFFYRVGHKKISLLVIYLRLFVWLIATLWSCIIFVLFSYRAFYYGSSLFILISLSLFFLTSLSPFLLLLSWFFPILFLF